MPSNYERKSFIDDVVSYDLLDDAIIWIKNNMGPCEVFDNDRLEEWAKENDYIKSGE